VRAAVSRRTLLAGGAGLAVGAAATEGGNLLAGGGTAASKALTPGEDLMREHGVLKRVLLTYRAVGERLAAGTSVPVSTVHGGATVVHDYIEGFHEGLEEGYVFPALQAAGQLVDTVDTLLVQHARGRRLTSRVLDATSGSSLTPAASTQLQADLAAFVRMYEPHEAWEDTVVYPALRMITPQRVLDQLAERFADLENAQYGDSALTTMLGRVEGIEQQLGIGDLDSFTPAAP
jgi:hemerythrin-like domain-containing protein